ncbi:MAG: hypothetical protein KC621_08555 [Myxococcales bacterium]|nr:hypothetical protein [Myxococcales bacterium]
MPERPASGLGARFVNAAVRPLHLAPAAVGLVGSAGLLVLGLAPLAVALGGLSVSAWGAMVAWDLVSQPAALPGPKEADRSQPLSRGISALHLRRAVDELEEKSRRVRKRIDAHDGVLSGSLLEVRADCDGLLAGSVAMARRGDTIHAYLQSSDPMLIEREAEDRERAARGARDPATAEAFRSAAEAKRRQLQTWTQLRQLHDRIVAELVSAGAALDELDARVVRVTLDDPGESRDVTVGREVKALRERISILEQSAAKTLQEVA